MTLAICNPALGSLITELAVDEPASVAAKVRVARAAQPAWAARPIAERCRCIAAFRAAIVAQREALAAMLTSETGKPITMSRSELDGLLDGIDFFLQQGIAAVACETVFADATLREQIEHVPLGVVGNISAWNYPWFVGCNVIVPALLTGNAVLYKPSEHATLTGLAIGRLLHDAGVPRDVLSVLVGAGDVGAALLAQPIDGLFFTGSHATGARIAAALAGRLIRLQLELGGKDSAYVCEDADLTSAVATLLDGAMYNTGQGCSSVERIYVHERVHDAFVQAFVQAARSLRIGDPTRDDTYIGPITRAAQLDVFDDQLRDARARGASVLCGGARLSGPGNWYPPTVVADVDHTMALMREETFGPLVGIQRVRDDAQALASMNDSRYGLTASVFTPDEARARALLAQVRAGTVYWNSCDRASPRLPWSGVGDSGIGLTSSTYGMQAFTRVKAWYLRRT